MFPGKLLPVHLICSPTFSQRWKDERKGKQSFRRPEGEAGEKGEGERAMGEKRERSESGERKERGRHATLALAGQAADVTTGPGCNLCASGTNESLNTK